MSDIIINRVVHPDTQKTLGFEFVDSNGVAYYDAPRFTHGLLYGPFPIVRMEDGRYVEPQRIEIARLGKEA